MNVITWISIAAAALYINLSFVFQIKLIGLSDNKWLTQFGLDSFNQNSSHAGENIAAYAITVIVYIVCLIYRKAASRQAAKTIYIDSKNKIIKMNSQASSGLRARRFRKKNLTTFQSIARQISHLIKNPYLHLMVFRLFLFGWIFLYFSFQSLVPLFLFCHSIVYHNRVRFISWVKYFYLPLMWFIFFFHYIINIEGLFSDSIFREENRRFGFFFYNPSFIHLAYQLITLFYGCMTMYLFREYDRRLKKYQEYKDRQEAKKQAKLDRDNSRAYKSSMGGQSSIADSMIGDFANEQSTLTYEILLRYFLKNIDILLMVALYYAGVNRIDVYHMFLLVLFVVYIMYPVKFRKNFILLLYFMIFIAVIKYFYVLFLPEFRERRTLNDIFKVLGFSTDIQKGYKYGKSNLINNNYLIVFTGFIQYRLYTSDYSKSAFSDEQAETDAHTFGRRFPRIMSLLTVLTELFQMAIPWITYVVFIIIAIVNNKSLINWVLLTMTLILMFWHITADLVTTTSHIRITRGWNVFTLVAAVCFLMVIIFQILSMDPIAEWSFTQSTVDSIPDFLVRNHKLIGLENYTDFSIGELFVKFLAYVAYFNLSVITRRQFIKSSVNVSSYEINNNQDLVKVPPKENQSEGDVSSVKPDHERKLEVKFSLVFVIYKLKWLWPIFDTISWHMFTVLSITIMILALHWKLSVATMIYLVCCILYYIWLPFKLEPKLEKSKVRHGASVSAKDLSVLWTQEDKKAKGNMVELRNYFVFLICLSTIVFISLLHLSSNLQTLKITYQDNARTFENMIFYTFFAGFNHNQQENGNSYFFEISGFLLVLFLCALERKSEVWLTNKYGFEGSVYDSFEGNIILQMYGRETTKKGEYDELKPKKEVMDAIAEEDEDAEEEEEKLEKHSVINKSGKMISHAGINRDAHSEPNAKELEEQQQIENLFEKEKKDGVKSLLKMEYLLFIAKTFRVIIFVTALLISLFAVVQKSNIWGGMILIAVIFTSFRKCNYNNIKWFGLAYCVIFLLEYASALANLSQLNSPSVFPSPFNDRGIERPLNVPLFREFGDPITSIISSGPEQGELSPTKWAFYLGFLISYGRLHSMWIDWIVILLVNYFAIYFYSTAYELDMNLNTMEAVQQNFRKIEDEAEESVVGTLKGSFALGPRKGSHQLNPRANPIQDKASIKNNSVQGKSDLESELDETYDRRGSTFDEASAYIRKIEKSMIICKLYNGISTFVCATSSIMTLVCLLMISFQIRGLINLIYICFCLYHISRSIKFIYQNGWTFPNGLKRILKPVVIIEITLQFMYQIPVDALHSGEEDPSGWQRIIGFRSVWKLNDDNLPITFDAGNIIYKCIMYAFILTQQNILACEEYKRFTSSTLPSIRNLSERKARAMAYLYNNFKIKTTIKNQFEKDKMMKKLARVNKQLKKWNQTVFSKTSKEAQEENINKIKKIMKENEKTPIKEVEAEKEEEKESFQSESFDKSSEVAKEIKEAGEKSDDDGSKFKELTLEEIVEAVAEEEELKELSKSDLASELITKNIGMLWKVWIYARRNFTNQILLVFNLKKLEDIIDEVFEGETKIYTHLEEHLIKDYENNKVTKEENGCETIKQLPDDKRSGYVKKATSGKELFL